MSRLPVSFCAVILAGAAGCAHTGAGEELRMPEDVPSQFVTEDGEPAVQECRSPMIDPRDQTRLRLTRSSHMGSLYRGDYEVPSGKYGVREGELLRINCETGQVIGIVSN
jgi:hypothetical protein